MFAYIKHKPIGKRRFYDQVPRLYEGDFTWTEEDWTVARSLGSPDWEPTRLTLEGAMPKGDFGAVYDARVVSAEDEEQIRQMQMQIAALQGKLRAFVDEQFKTWRPVTKTDCVHHRIGRTKAAVIESLKTRPKESAKTIATEREAAKGLADMGFLPRAQRQG